MAVDVINEMKSEIAMRQKTIAYYEEMRAQAEDRNSYLFWNGQAEKEQIALDILGRYVGRMIDAKGSVA